jgi:serine/threonine-protein kinase
MADSASSLWRRAFGRALPRDAGRTSSAAAAPAASSFTDSALAPASGFAPGAVFAGFRIERVIARGAASRLYGAIDPRTGEAVALKTLALAGEYEGDDLIQARSRFFQEARTAAALRHPDIVHVHGGGESRGCGFIVMELLAGCDLSRYTRPARLLPEPLVLDIVARVADALAHAHDTGVLHRDVKPANVMVDLAQHQVKLTDFGIARTIDAARSRSGVMLGTPSYMAPEQLAGAALDPRADLYALGVVLFQLLTGRLPYDAPSMGQLLMQIARAEPRELRQLRPELPPALGVLVGRLLAKSPAERPGDGRAVAAALRELAAGSVPRTPPVPGRPATSGAPGATDDPRHNPREPDRTRA